MKLCNAGGVRDEHTFVRKERSDSIPITAHHVGSARFPPGMKEFHKKQRDYKV